jgi:hypothetical protein
MSHFELFAFSSVIAAIFLIWALYNALERWRLHKKYGPILSIDQQVSEAEINLSRIQRDANTKQKEIESQREKTQSKITELTTQYASLRQIVDLELELKEAKIQTQAKLKDLNTQYSSAHDQYLNLKKELSIVEENIEDMSFGLYKPHFDYATSEEYRQSLEAIRTQQKVMIRKEKAAICDKNWTVEGSVAKGTQMTKKNMKLMLRAFNGECDAAAANVAWNNISKMEARIQKVFEAVNKLGASNYISLNKEYLLLKLSELRLVHEYEEKKYQEREEQRQIKELMREEERAQREFEKAKVEAEREEFRFQKALEKARQELLTASVGQVEVLNAEIAALQTRLDEAHALKERAISQAELTRSGYVYIISNIGSFGEDVFKLGMTRRLEPMDRIRELGDASVPFGFDVHAMIYCDDAPSLECALHNYFTKRRVNLVNPRKEFFKISLEDIEAFAEERQLDLRLTKLAEAKEYRETLTTRKELEAGKVAPIVEPCLFPAELEISLSA